MSQSKESLKEGLKEAGACHVVRDYIAHFANPVRLRLLCELVESPRSVGELVEASGARQSAVSQQLKHLRLAGLVTSSRQGNRIVYRIIDPLAVETMHFVFSLAERLVASGRAGNASTECPEPLVVGALAANGS